MIFNDGDILNLDNLTVLLDGLPIVRNLNLNEITRYLKVDSGENRLLQIVDINGNIISSKLVSLEVDVFHAIVITVDINGKPLVDVIEFKDSDFDLQDGLLERLQLNSALKDGPIVNILNMSNMGDDALLGGLDILNGNRQFVDGILELPERGLSNAIPADAAFLRNIDILSSDRSIDDLLNILVGRDYIDGFDNLGGIAIVEGVGEILEDVLRIVDELLGGLLGLGGEPVDFDLLRDNILGGMEFQRGSNYTLIITGDQGNLEFTWVNQTQSGMN